jgi:hypothetical protein
MYLAIENGDVNDSIVLKHKYALLDYLKARMIAGVDVDVDIDVYPIDPASRVDTLCSVALLDGEDDE